MQKSSPIFKKIKYSISRKGLTIELLYVWAAALNASFFYGDKQ
ncbi:hypothetical protein FHT21_000463 [Pedobacter sp. SG908]|nr:hypothetical protein [Pedobacter sp. SG908]NMN35423.1 hypothetical protein [Pedobacter sp. SG918]